MERNAMNSFVKRILVAAAPLSLAIAAPAAAQAQITPGMQVTDPSGGLVGTVTKVEGDNLVVKTPKHEVMLPKASFTPASGKLLFGLTQAQLDAEVEKSAAAGDAAIKAGATVKGAQGATIGTIDAADATNVTITLTSGKKVQMIRASLRVNADGTVTTGLTADQLHDEIEKATAAAPGQGK
jgi:preprotein translocase subunit YajC